MITPPDHTRGRLIGVFQRVVRALPAAPRPLLTPLQPLLQHLLLHILRQRPALTDRMGDKVDRCIRLDAHGLPFSFLLRLDPQQPMLRAVPNGAIVPSDARIAGDLLTLVNMVDGAFDGDALFFSRSITIDGDTDAVVRLRNALDDLEGSVLDDVTGFFGPPARLIVGQLRAARNNQAEEALL